MVVFKINGQDFSSMVLKIERSANKLDKYAERTIDGDLKREVIGTYLNYKLSFGNSTYQKKKYNQMFLGLIRPIDFVKVTIPVNGKNYTFEGYISNVQDNIVYISDKDQIYEGLSCDIVTRKPTWKAGYDSPSLDQF